MKFGSEKRREPVEINVTSLVDIIFNLLLFFLLTTSFSESAGVDIELPNASERVPVETNDHLVIGLSLPDIITVGNETVPKDVLSSRVRVYVDKRVAEGKTPKVLLQADRDVAHGDVVGVMDIAKQAGVTELNIATQ